MSDLIENKTTGALYKSLLAEAAKSQSEMRCAQRDINKALTRLSFIILIINNLIDREELHTGD